MYSIHLYLTLQTFDLLTEFQYIAVCLGFFPDLPAKCIIFLNRLLLSKGAFLRIPAESLASPIYSETLLTEGDAAHSKPVHYTLNIFFGAGAALV